MRPPDVMLRELSYLRNHNTQISWMYNRQYKSGSNDGGETCLESNESECTCTRINKKIFHNLDTVVDIHKHPDKIYRLG